MIRKKRPAKRVSREWKKAQALYFENRLSIRAISRRCGIAEPTLRYRVKAEGWERGPAQDLTENRIDPVFGKVEAAPSVRGLTKKRKDAEICKPPGGAKSADAENAPPAPADAQSVQPAPIDPSAIADRGRDLVARMLAELEAITANSAELRAAILDATKDDGDGRRRARLLRLVDLPSRAIVLKDLMTAAKTLAAPAPEAATGKKVDAKAKAAKVAASGRFATPPVPPKLIVNNDPGRR